MMFENYSLAKKIPLIITASLLSGCLSVDLHTMSEVSGEPRFEKEYYQNTYTGKWVGDEPEKDLKKQLQPHRKDDIDESGLYRIVVNQTAWQVCKGLIFLGRKTPVTISWWFEDTELADDEKSGDE